MTAGETNQVFSEEDVLEQVDVLQKMINGGSSVGGAMAALKYVPPRLLDLARAEYERQVGILGQGEDPDVIGSRERKTGLWYGGPRESDWYWPRLKAALEEELPAEVVDSVDKSSSTVIGYGKPAGTNPNGTRGLVLGYVQSGKTTNFMSVVSKAADIGYRLIIVLTGTTENLRYQTQQRVDDYLQTSSQEKWNPLTTREHDFAESTSGTAIFQNSEMRSIAVVKKNPARMRRLNKWLRESPKTVLNNLPILIIDDEADQASINVGIKRQSTINKLLMELLEFPRSAYIAYTATPFANLLVDPSKTKDIYPKDFIVDLPRPVDYFGAERIFGNLAPTDDDEDSDGMDIVRTIPLDEVDMVRPPSGKGAVDQWVPDAPESLKRAVIWFVLATSARRVRSGKVKHSSMLIHTSMKATAHEATAQAVFDLVQDLRAEHKNSNNIFISKCSKIWCDEDRIDSESFGLRTISFESIIPEIENTLGSLEIIVDNYRSLERLKYPKDNPQTVIVVGGNTLSRGLTLEGLISSYFVRSASAYDTLLQMGRWFGFRIGYEDLVRIWLTEELQEWFLQLALVENEIRRDIQVYAKEGKTPAEIPVMIRTHPQMAITSAAKMRNSVLAKISYSGKRVQTILFKERDADWLTHNIDSVSQLFTSLTATGHDCTILKNQRRAFIGVGADMILSFLDNYRLHDNAQSINKDAIKNYVGSERLAGSLETWNVVLMEPITGGVPGQEIPPLGDVMYRQRQKMAGTDATANLKAITSTTDRVADLDLSAADIKTAIGLSQNVEPSDIQLLKLRELRGMHRIGLLCIYPIARSSAELKVRESVSDHRRPLNADADLLGVSFMFPPAYGKQGDVDYRTADLKPSYLEDLEELEPELEASDQMDEQIAEQEEGLHK